MTSSAMTQIQVRIDAKTKAKKILNELGLDVSTAVKILFKQIVYTGTLPLELRDVNGFRPHKAKELEEAIIDVEKSKEGYTSVDKLMKNLL